MRQVRNVASDVFVQDAWARGQELSVHGWVYSLANGLVTDLDVTVGPGRGGGAVLRRRADAARRRGLHCVKCAELTAVAKSRLSAAEMSWPMPTS